MYILNSSWCPVVGGALRSRKENLEFRHDSISQSQRILPEIRGDE